MGSNEQSVFVAKNEVSGAQSQIRIKIGLKRLQGPDFFKTHFKQHTL